MNINVRIYTHGGSVDVKAVMTGDEKFTVTIEDNPSLLGGKGALFKSGDTYTVYIQGRDVAAKLERRPLGLNSKWIFKLLSQ